MASFTRPTAGNSAEQVECLDELLTNILSRLSTRDVLKMSTVRKRWRALIFDPVFANTHYKNCHKESIFCLTHTEGRQTPEQYQFRSYNSQTGNLSTVPFSLEGLDNSFQNESFGIVTVANGLMCFYPNDPVDVPVLCVYNPVTKFLKKLPAMPFEVDIETVYFVEICYSQNTLKFVMIGSSLGEEHPYALVFDSHLNSWYRRQHLPKLGFINMFQYDPLGTQLFLNGVIYFVIGVETTDAHELDGFRNMIIGYDVNQDQWGFSLSVPDEVGFIFRLFEWEGNLIVCASNDGDGLFVFWILDTERKEWIQERKLNLTHELHTSWEVSVSGGVIWFTCGYNSVIVYHMKNGQWSRRRLPDAFGLRQQRSVLPFVTFEPTLLSFEPTRLSF